MTASRGTAGPAGCGSGAPTRSWRSTSARTQRRRPAVRRRRVADRAPPRRDAHRHARAWRRSPTTSRCARSATSPPTSRDPARPTPSSTCCATCTRRTSRSSRRSRTASRSRGTSVNSIAVISRADEIGSSRTNAMAAAERVAARYRQRPAGPLAVPGRRPRRRTDRPGGQRPCARTRRWRCATSPRSDPARHDGPAAVRRAVHRGRRCRCAPDPTAMRHRLLDRLGLFGVRLAVELIAAEPRQLRRPSWRAELEAAQRDRRAAPAPDRPVRRAGRRAQGPLDAGDGVGARRPARRQAMGGCSGAGQGHRERGPRARRDPACCRSCGRAPCASATTACEARQVLGDDGADPRHRLGLPPTACPTTSAAPP